MTSFHRIMVALLLPALFAPSSLAHVRTSANLNGGQSGSTSWHTYKVDGEDFSVDLPVTPAMSTQSMHVDRSRSRRERTIAAYADGVVYAIYTYEQKGMTLDAVIGRFSKAQLSEPVTVNGFTGGKMRFDDDNRTVVIEFFATNKNIYVFQAVGSHVVNPIAGMTRFLSSIKFGKSPVGDSIVDGPGGPPASPAGVMDASSILRSAQTTTRAYVVSKPEPSYTEAARMNQVTGTIVLRVVFSAAGAVENINAMKSLPDGLTENAIAAARQIRFIPAVKDGHFVSVWMQLEYNFNLY
jgi:TonB family protein